MIEQATLYLLTSELRYRLDNLCSLDLLLSMTDTNSLAQQNNRRTLSSFSLTLIVELSYSTHVYTHTRGLLIREQPVQLTLQT